MINVEFVMVAIGWFLWLALVQFIGGLKSLGIVTLGNSKTTTDGTNYDDTIQNPISHSSTNIITKDDTTTTTQPESTFISIITNTSPSSLRSWNPSTTSGISHITNTQPSTTSTIDNVTIFITSTIRNQAKESLTEKPNDVSSAVIGGISFVIILLIAALALLLYFRHKKKQEKVGLGTLTQAQSATDGASDSVGSPPSSDTPQFELQFANEILVNNHVDTSSRNASIDDPSVNSTLYGIPQLTNRDFPENNDLNLLYSNSSGHNLKSVGGSSVADKANPVKGLKGTSTGGKFKKKVKKGPLDDQLDMKSFEHETDKSAIEILSETPTND